MNVKGFCLNPPQIKIVSFLLRTALLALVVKRKNGGEATRCNLGVHPSAQGLGKKIYICAPVELDYLTLTNARRCFS